MDACCADTGFNAMCSNYASPAKSFLDATASGQHVWLHPPADLAQQFVEHLLAAWQVAPQSTSGCVILPASLDFLATSEVRPFRLLCKIGKGERVLQSYTDDGSKGPLLRTSAPLHVYQLDPAPSAQYLQAIHTPADTIDTSPLLETSPLAFLFDAVCHALRTTASSTPSMPSRLLVDTGATTPFASYNWVYKHGLTINPSHHNWKVTVADNGLAKVRGTVTLNLQLGKQTNKQTQR